MTNLSITPIPDGVPPMPLAADYGIDHAEQLQRMIDAYDRLLTKAVEHKFSLSEHAEFEHLRRVMRQAIEQAWDAGHACQEQHAAKPTVVGNYCGYCPDIIVQTDGGWRHASGNRGHIAKPANEAA